MLKNVLLGSFAPSADGVVVCRPVFSPTVSCTHLIRVMCPRHCLSHGSRDPTQAPSGDLPSNLISGLAISGPAWDSHRLCVLTANEPTFPRAGVWKRGGERRSPTGLNAMCPLPSALSRSPESGWLKFSLRDCKPRLGFLAPYCTGSSVSR